MLKKDDEIIEMYVGGGVYLELNFVDRLDS